MPAFVNIGTIAIGGSSNGAGIFSGQNMQNNWDSNSPTISSLGSMMGNRCIKSAYYCVLESESVLSQPLYDQDIKCNLSPMWMGP